jgi:cytosine/adenosine deaminase-related metal-dependent hydrolase
MSDERVRHTPAPESPETSGASTAQHDDSRTATPVRRSRREFLKTGAGLAAAAAATQLLPGAAFAQPGTPATEEGKAVERLNQDPKRRLLLKDGCVLSLSSNVGNFLRADVLIEGKEIVAVGPDLAVPSGAARVIDARGTIVLPGFVDTHRHCWQNYFRRAIPNGTIEDYRQFTHQGFAPFVRPQDHYAGNLISGLGAIYTGVTSVLDYSHNSRSRAHVDAAIQAHFDSGLRAVFAYGPVSFGEWDEQWPEDIRRVKQEFFPSDDQLVTLRLATGLIPENYALAREIGVRITTDGAVGPPRNETFVPQLLEFGRLGLLGPDVTLIHGTAFPDEAFRLMADTGTRLALATTSDAQIFGLGDDIPPIQQALDFGLVTGLSVDVETNLSTDFFSQMRATFHIQRMLAGKRAADGDPNAPAPMTVRQVLQMATRGGALCNGLERKVGNLVPGKEADLVIIDAEDILTMPLNNAIGTVVIGADTSSVRDVLIAGQFKKRNGKLVGVDVERIRRLVHESRDYVARASGLWEPDDILGGGPFWDPATASATGEPAAHH